MGVASGRPERSRYVPFHGNIDPYAEEVTEARRIKTPAMPHTCVRPDRRIRQRPNASVQWVGMQITNALARGCDAFAQRISYLELMPAVDRGSSRGLRATPAVTDADVSTSDLRNSRAPVIVASDLRMGLFAISRAFTWMPFRDIEQTTSPSSLDCGEGGQRAPPIALRRISAILSGHVYTPTGFTFRLGNTEMSAAPCKLRVNLRHSPSANVNKINVEPFLRKSIPSDQLFFSKYC